MQKLNLDSELLKPMREQFEIILNRLVGIVATQNKEAEITLKLNLDSTKQYEEVDEKTVKEWVEPRIDYSISEKIKETKNKRSRSFVAPQVLMTKIKEIYNNQKKEDLIFN